MKQLHNNEQHYLVYRALAILWMAIIYWLSSKPSLPAPDLFWGQDKVEHALAFGLLGFLIASSFRASQHASFKKRVVIVTLIVGGYGFFDETHQFFVPGRDASFWDLFADSTGGFLSAFLFLRYKSRKLSREEVTPLS